MTEGRVYAIKGCNQFQQADTHVCSGQEHIEAEHIHVECGQAHFQLKDHLERACILHPNDSMLAEECTLDDVVGNEAE